MIDSPQWTMCVCALYLLVVYFLCLDPLEIGSNLSIIRRQAAFLRVPSLFELENRIF